EPRGAQYFELRALEQEFEHRRAGRILQELVRPAGRVVIHHPAERHAEPREARTTQILNGRSQTGAKHFEHFNAHNGPASTGTNFTRSPGCRKNTSRGSVSAARFSCANRRTSVRPMR